MRSVSIALPKDLNLRLRQVAKSKGLTLSEFVRKKMIAVLETEEATKRKSAYKAFENMQGLVTGTGITDTSQKIDEILYGEQGVWQGETTLDGSDNLMEKS